MPLNEVAEIQPIRNPVNFLGELFEQQQWPPTLANPSNDYARSYDIYEFSIKDTITDYENYWIEWGGTFDNPTIAGIQLFFDVFLTEVYLESAVLSTVNSFWVDDENDMVYFNTPLYPWQYFSAYSSLYGNILSTFSTAPKNPLIPSDTYYGAVLVRPVMEVPSLENQITDVISGVSVYNTFTLNIDNSDGYYDFYDILNYFNTPLKISKSSTGSQIITDYNQVRYGIVNDIKVGFGEMEVEASDQFFLFNADFCSKFTKDDYPFISDSDENNDIPVAWGQVKGIEPIEVNKDTADPPTWIDYIALDPDYITGVAQVYDEDGNTLTYSFNSTTGVIRVTEVDGDGEVIEASYMTVTGKTNNTIGEIIIDALSQAENIQYIDGLWDLEETDYYLSICSDVAFYFDGGTTRDLLEAVLKNDSVFLIQKNDGVLTLRRWGEDYITHQIPYWLITQQPKKNFRDAMKYYASSVIVKYNKFEKEDRYENSYLDDSVESFNFERYRRSYTAEFETQLGSLSDATDLSGRLLDRFGVVRETIEIGVGVDTFNINPLDKVEIDMQINDRLFSEYSEFIVKKCDPGQDILTLEGLEKYYLLTFDGDTASLDSVDWYIEGDL